MQNQNGGEIISPARSQRWSRGIMCVYLTMLCLFVGLLAGFCVIVGDTWNQSCDYDLKVWVIVHLSRVIIGFVVGLLVFRYQKRTGRSAQATPYGVIKSLLDVFGFAWWLYGIKVVLVDEGCKGQIGADDVATSWGVGLWWYQFVLYVLPCMIFCVLACLVLRASGQLQDEQTNPTPPDVVNSILVQPWAAVKHAANGPDSADSPQPEFGRTVNAASDGIGALTGVTFPADDAAATMNRLNTRIRTDAASPGAENLNSRAGRACPICFADFMDEDDVMVLPCSKKHVYHSLCIKTWMEKSQQCPVCRKNIVEHLKKQQEAAWSSV